MRLSASKPAPKQSDEIENTTGNAGVHALQRDRLAASQATAVKIVMMYQAKDFKFIAEVAAFLRVAAVQ